MPDAQKYTRGVVGVRAGSAAYPGAGVLCVAGAASGLCGMVRYVGGAPDAVLAAHPDVVAGTGQVQAWTVGSGGGVDVATMLAEALGDGVPTVIDADALALVDEALTVPAVLTPHAGELARMTGADRAEIEAAPLRHARAAAERYAAVVLLKGRRTVVARPDGGARVTTTGVPWLATAGAGDVLAGLIGALLAAGLDPFDAASVGSWLHGAAATLASGGGPLSAVDVARALPAVGARPALKQSGACPPPLAPRSWSTWGRSGTTCGPWPTWSAPRRDDDGGQGRRLRPRHGRGRPRGARRPAPTGWAWPPSPRRWRSAAAGDTGPAALLADAPGRRRGRFARRAVAADVDVTAYTVAASTRSSPRPAPAAGPRAAQGRHRALPRRGGAG